MLKYIKYLIENGTEINPNTVYNDTPLYYAILLNQYDVINLLINNNVKLDYPNYECKYTPIFHLLLNECIQYNEKLD